MQEYRKKTISYISVYQFAFVICVATFFLVDSQSLSIGFLARIAQLCSKYSFHYVMSIFLIILSLFLSRFKVRLGDSLNYLIPGIVLLLITIIYQLFNGYMSYSYKELVALYVPILVYISVITTYGEDNEFNVDTIFYLTTVFFVLRNIGLFSWKNISTIDFLSSYSAFESKYAYYGVVLEFYYMYKKDFPKTLVSFVICALSLKRVAFVFGLITICLYKVFPRDKKVKTKYIILTMIAFIAAPLLVQLMCSESFGNWFYNVTGLNLNAFVSGRISKFNAVFDSGEMKYGWGSSSVYLTTHISAFAQSTSYYEGKSINMHSDIVKLYCECTIVGLFTFLYYHLKSVKEYFPCYVLLLYLLTDMLVNHHLGIGKALLWIMIYIVLNKIKEDIDDQRDAIQSEQE